MEISGSSKNNGNFNINKKNYTNFDEADYNKYTDIQFNKKINIESDLNDNYQENSIHPTIDSFSSDIFDCQISRKTEEKRFFNDDNQRKIVENIEKNIFIDGNNILNNFTYKDKNEKTSHQDGNKNENENENDGRKYGSKGIAQYFNLKTAFYVL